MTAHILSVEKHDMLQASNKLYAVSIVAVCHFGNSVLTFLLLLSFHSRICECPQQQHNLQTLGGNYM